MFYSVFIVHDQMSCYHAALFFFEINSALSVSQMYATPASLISVQVILAEIVAPLCACCKDISCIMTLLQFMLVVFQHLEDTCIDPQSCRKSPQLPSLSSGTESVFKPSFRLDVRVKAVSWFGQNLCANADIKMERNRSVFSTYWFCQTKREVQISLAIPLSSSWCFWHPFSS